MLSSQVRYYASGYYKIRASGNDLMRLFNMCAFHGVDIRDLCRVQEEYFFSVSRKDMPVFLELCQKTNVCQETVEERGLPYFVRRIRNHITFFLGAGGAFLLMLLLSQMIWNIQIIGNSGYGKEEILRFLKSRDITHGMFRQDVNCFELSADLRASFPNITWVTVRISGTNLVVEMKENILDEDRKEFKPESPSDIVCEKDGVIVHMITRSGIARYGVGMTCKKGDILVEGLVPIYNDSGERIRLEPVASDAEIRILTTRSYYEEFSLAYEKEVLLSSKETPYFQIGRWSFDFSSSESSEYSVKAARNSHRLYLTETLALPVFYGKRKDYFYQKETDVYKEDEARTIAQRHLSLFLEELEKKGVQIYENNVKIEITDAKCIAKGEILVIEETGKNVSFSPEERISIQSQEE